MSDDLDEIMDGLALWQEHRPQTAEDWVGVAKRCAADETFDHTKSTPIFGSAFLLAREVAATTDERPVRLPVPAPETLDTSRLVARVEELTRQLAVMNEAGHKLVRALCRHQIISSKRPTVEIDRAALEAWAAASLKGVGNDESASTTGELGSPPAPDPLSPNPLEGWRNDGA